MADTTYPPFMSSYGKIPALLAHVKQAQTPDRFTNDLLKTMLGYRSGSAEAFVPLLKRIGFLNTDGTPTELYRRYRNDAESGWAMAEAMRKGYHAVYALAEHAHDLPRADLEGVLIKVTGLAKDSPTIRAISKTFEALKAEAKFDGGPAAKIEPPPVEKPPALPPHTPELPPRDMNEVGMNLSYTINLNLPETENIAVFNAIFTALRTHLLRK